MDKYSKRFMILMMLILIVGLLGACGSSNEEVSGESSEPEEEVFPALNDVPLGLNKISFEELIEKLDNKESFWLVTIDYQDKKTKEMGELVNLEKNFDQELKANKMGAYFVDFYEYKEKYGDYLVSKDGMNERYRHKEHEDYLNFYTTKTEFSFEQNANLFFVTNYGIDELTQGKDMIRIDSDEDSVEGWIGDGAVKSGRYEERIKDDIKEKIELNLSSYEDMTN